MRNKLARTVFMTATALLCLSALAGCYERTVSARGMGADQYTISEPYQESGQIDDWIFGPRPETQRRGHSLLER